MSSPSTTLLLEPGPVPAPASPATSAAPAPSQAPVRLQLLGEFALHAQGRRLAVAPAQQRLLAFLAVNRRPIARASLAHRLWPDTDERHGSSALRSILWRLPRPGDLPVVCAEGSTVRLADSVVVDLWESERQARTPAASGARDAAAWTEDLLPDWSEEWLLLERESHLQLRLHALERHSAERLAAGDHAAALQAALAATRGDPLRESAHRGVIEVHLAQGDHDAALRAFHRYRRLLATELGLPPSADVWRLVAPSLGRRPRRVRAAQDQ